uniref:NADH-ubiquinone oxidoreductase chain 6 n=1 Tax=Conogethes punctiferalis TaxID=1133088 RepID=R4IKE6_CONPF|nr:NADH dehydrogenase subunit 6 [Conogethes punctiferalis]AFR25732.1 NADH dehydrogenase subunit 6 [Conogethes punctiferalis]AOY36200.1 NADH dehydrogenase subunit 6 [Conogethes punctiferalis]UJH93363.1 NADH dehydrogenase subunit 6 [Conogethes punctiferalis]
MMKMFFSLLIILFSFLMLFLYHPLSMGLMILIQTMLTCLITGIFLSTYWFSYILFLTFLGGLLVLFIYVSSIASNEIFKISFNMKIMFFFSIFIIFFISMLSINNLFWMNFNINLEIKNFFDMFLFFNNENKINLNKLYNNQTFMMMMMMIIYLFITLIAVVKITNIFFGPLRSSFN